MTESKPMVTFPEAIKSCLRQYVGFSGRATRAEYWWWLLGVLGGGFLLGIVDGIIFGFEVDSGGIFRPLFGLATLLPLFAVTVRRLHDIGRTGWWLLIWVGIGVSGWIVGLAVGVSAFFVMESLVAGLVTGVLIAGVVTIGVWVWQIWWLVKQGQMGPNQYGPDPRALDS